MSLPSVSARAHAACDHTSLHVCLQRALSFALRTPGARRRAARARRRARPPPLRRSAGVATAARPRALPPRVEGRSSLDQHHNGVLAPQGQHAFVRTARTRPAPPSAHRSGAPEARARTRYAARAKVGGTGSTVNNSGSKIKIPEHLAPAWVIFSCFGRWVGPWLWDPAVSSDCSSRAADPKCTFELLLLWVLLHRYRY